MKVQLYDLVHQTKALRAELMAAVERVLLTGRYILGPEVHAFEQEVGAYLGVGYSIGVAASATW